MASVLENLVDPSSESEDSSDSESTSFNDYERYVSEKINQQIRSCLLNKTKRKSKL